MLPSAQQIEGVIRSVMLALSGAAMLYGLDEATWALITGAIVAVATTIWSVWTKTTKQILDQAAELGEVETIIVHDHNVAQASPSKKVISVDDPA